MHPRGPPGILAAQAPPRGTEASAAWGPSALALLIGAAAGTLHAAVGASDRNLGLVTRFWIRARGRGTKKQYYSKHTDEIPGVYKMMKFPTYVGGNRDWGDYFHPEKHGPRRGAPRLGKDRYIPNTGKGRYEGKRNRLAFLTTEVIRHGRIKTTASRAITLMSFVNRMIELTKIGTDEAKQEAQEWMTDERLVENMFESAPERYRDRDKYYTRVVPTMFRKSDCSLMAYIELV